MRAVGIRLIPAEQSVFAVVLLLMTAFAGCMDDGVASEPGELSFLEVYEYRFLGDDVMHPDHPYGWMVRVTNVMDETAALRVLMDDEEGTVWGPVTSDGWSQTGAAPQAVDPGTSVLYLFERTGGHVPSLEYGVQLVDAVGDEPRVLQDGSFNRSLERSSAGDGVQANHHVATSTVGVWINGTSFYTNIRDLNDDPAFPAGYDRDNFNGNDLRVYVYDEEPTEQPAGSRDRCYFVTIPGYNELLKTQAEGTSNVRFLAPEEAYTRTGNEDHWLYGDALIFLNHLVSHMGEVTQLQAAPQPTGDCFDLDHTSPVPLPEAPGRGDPSGV